MTFSPLVRCLLLALVVGVSLPAWSFAGQDPLARAKEFYASASYDEALQVLDQLRGRAPSPSATEIAAYQIFCLVALGRNQEATAAIAAMVRVDPLYQPSDGEVSPRILAFFENVRRPLLPAAVRQLYAKAKDSLDRKEMAQASAEFDRVIALLDEMETADDQGVADLRMLASGFRDFSKVAAAPPPPVVVAPPPPPVQVARPEPPASSPARTAAAEPRVYSPSDAGVTKPIAISRVLPPWRVTSAIERLTSFSGSVELLIDEKGNVVSARIVDSVRADYDPSLLKAAPAWTFQPATKDGVAVRYRYLMEIQSPNGR